MKYEPVPIAIILSMPAVVFGAIGLFTGVFVNNSQGLIVAGAILISGGIIAMAIAESRKKG